MNNIFYAYILNVIGTTGIYRFIVWTELCLIKMRRMEIYWSA